MTVKAYSYARFSNEKQASGDSVRRQEAAAQKYANDNQLELDQTLRYTDKGISAYRGRNAARGTELSKFLEAVQAGVVAKGSVLIVENLDRLSRQTSWDATEILRNIVNAGITVAVLSHKLELSRATLRSNPMLYQMVVWLFQQGHEESLKKAGRVRDAWVGKRLKLSERKLTAACPAWLTLDRTTDEFIVNEERAAVVGRVFADTLRGIGQNKLAAMLNLENVPVFGEGKRKGRHWHRSYIVKLLRNPAAIGTLVPHTSEDTEDGRKVRKPLDPVPGYYPAIVEPEVFQSVQAMRLETSAPLRGRHVGAATISNLFGGMLRCGRCGAPVTVVNKGTPPKGYKYLVCTKAKASAGCEYETTRYDQVERYFLQALPRVLATAPAGDDGELEAEISTLEGLEAHHIEEISNIAREIARGGPSAALRETLRALERERKSVERQIGDALERQAAAAGPLVAKRVADVREASKAETLDRAHLNALLRQTFNRATLDRVTGNLVLSWRQGGESRVMVAWPKDDPTP